MSVCVERKIGQEGQGEWTTKAEWFQTASTLAASEAFRALFSPTPGIKAIVWPTSGSHVVTFVSSGFAEGTFKLTSGRQYPIMGEMEVSHKSKFVHLQTLSKGTNKWYNSLMWSIHTHKRCNSLSWLIHSQNLPTSPQTHSPFFQLITWLFQQIWCITLITFQLISFTTNQ